MSWKQEDLNALNEAIAQGVQKVVYRDKTIEYRSLAEMIKIRSMMEVELSPSKKLSTRIYMRTSKGL